MDCVKRWERNSLLHWLTHRKENPLPRRIQSIKTIILRVKNVPSSFISYLGCRQNIELVTFRILSGGMLNSYWAKNWNYKVRILMHTKEKDGKRNFLKKDPLWNPGRNARFMTSQFVLSVLILSSSSPWITNGPRGQSIHVPPHGPYCLAP